MPCFDATKIQGEVIASKDNENLMNESWRIRLWGKSQWVQNLGVSIKGM